MSFVDVKVLLFLLYIAKLTSDAEDFLGNLPALSDENVRFSWTLSINTFGLSVAFPSDMDDWGYSLDWTEAI